jgi:hypothetical protein
VGRDDFEEEREREKKKGMKNVTGREEEEVGEHPEGRIG